MTAYDATDNGATLVPNPKYSGPVKPSIDKLVLAPFTTDASEYLELQAGNSINIGYVPPAGPAPSTRVPAFSKDGSPLSGKNNAAAGERTTTSTPAYPWGVNYFALNYTNSTVRADLQAALHPPGDAVAA